MIFDKGVAYRIFSPRVLRCCANSHDDRKCPTEARKPISNEWLGHFAESPCVISFELRLLTRRGFYTNNYYLVTQR